MFSRLLADRGAQERQGAGPSPGEELTETVPEKLCEKRARLEMGENVVVSCGEEMR